MKATTATADPPTTYARYAWFHELESTLAVFISSWIKIKILQRNAPSKVK